MILSQSQPEPETGSRLPPPRPSRGPSKSPVGAHPRAGSVTCGVQARNLLVNPQAGASQEISQEHAALLKNRLYRRWGIKTAREYARIKMDGIRLVGGNPDFTNGDDDARFYDRQQAYVHARGG